MSLKQILKDFFTSRRHAYSEVFNPETPSGRFVMKDLARFCRAHKSTFHADPRMHAVAEGRREVFLRIMNHLKLNEDQFWDLYGRKDIE